MKYKYAGFTDPSFFLDDRFSSDDFDNGRESIESVKKCVFDKIVENIGNKPWIDGLLGNLEDTPFLFEFFFDKASRSQEFANLIIEKLPEVVIALGEKELKVFSEDSVNYHFIDFNNIVIVCHKNITFIKDAVFRLPVRVASDEKIEDTGGGENIKIKEVPGNDLMFSILTKYISIISPDLYIELIDSTIFSSENIGKLISLYLETYFGYSADPPLARKYAINCIPLIDKILETGNEGYVKEIVRIYNSMSLFKDDVEVLIIFTNSLYNNLLKVESLRTEHSDLFVSYLPALNTITKLFRSGSDVNLFLFMKMLIKYFGGVSCPSDEVEKEVYNHIVGLFDPWLLEFLPLIAKSDRKFKYNSLVVNFICMIFSENDIFNSLSPCFWEKTGFEFFEELISGFLHTDDEFLYSGLSFILQFLLQNFWNSRDFFDVFQETLDYFASSSDFDDVEELVKLREIVGKYLCDWSQEEN